MEYKWALIVSIYRITSQQYYISNTTCKYHGTLKCSSQTNELINALMTNEITILNKVVSEIVIRWLSGLQ